MRGEFVKGYLANGMFAVCPSYMDILLDTVHRDKIETVSNDSVAPSHSYEKRGSMAIITVDGAMTKKNTWMNAICGGVVGYDTIASYITMAESDPEVATIVFNVDTPGGEVKGADEVGEMIFNSTKETVTFYNNLGASAGIWVFSASDKLYANETAMIGSIGVMAGYRQSEAPDGTVTMVSKNAKNKSCAINGDCADKIQARIDQTEEIFYARVMRNTGLSAEEIASKFGFGDVISAKEAEAAGFLDGVMSFSQLIAKLGATMPASAKIVTNPQKGRPMEFTKANFEALLAEKAELVSANEAEKAQVASALQEVEALKAEMVAKKEADMVEMEARVREAIECGVSADTAIEMLKAESADKASLIALREKQSTGGTVQIAQPEITHDAEAEALAAYAQSHKGRIK